jgi:hypothetical protein
MDPVKKMFLRDSPSQIRAFMVLIVAGLSQKDIYHVQLEIVVYSIIKFYQPQSKLHLETFKASK